MFERVKHKTFNLAIALVVVSGIYIAVVRNEINFFRKSVTK